MMQKEGDSWTAKPREERANKKSKRKDCMMKEETGDYSPINLYIKHMMLEGMERGVGNRITEQVNSNHSPCSFKTVGSRLSVVSVEYMKGFTT
jgi:hypothetical protein